MVRTTWIKWGLLRTAPTPSSLKVRASCPWDTVGLFNYITQLCSRRNLLKSLNVQPNKTTSWLCPMLQINTCYLEGHWLGISNVHRVGNILYIGHSYLYKGVVIIFQFLSIPWCRLTQWVLEDTVFRAAREQMWQKNTTLTNPYSEGVTN